MKRLASLLLVGLAGCFTPTEPKAAPPAPVCLQTRVDTLGYWPNGKVAAMVVYCVRYR